MKPLPTIATLFLAATSCLAQSNDKLQNDLLKVANGIWTAVQQQDMKTMQTLTSPDFLFAGKEGILSGQELAGVTQHCTLHSFNLSSPQMRVLAPGVAVLVYKAAQQYECNGKPEPKELIVSDSFTRKQGKWIAVVHTEAVPAGAE